MTLPVFKAQIDCDVTSDLEVQAVALVDRPAIEKNFLAFKDIVAKYVLNEDKRIISGPAMLAEMPIYRNDDGYEYYIVFDRETINNIVQKFFKKGFVQSFNLFHDPAQTTTDITVFESFMVDRERGIQPMKGFEDAKDGSWFITAKVECDNAWNKVKSGELKGFSIEGIFRHVKVSMSKPQLTDDQILQKIKELLS